MPGWKPNANPGGHEVFVLHRLRVGAPISSSRCRGVTRGRPAVAGGHVMSGDVASRVAEFVALRRVLGYRSPSQDRALRSFARYLDAAGYPKPIPLESSLNWATATASTDPRNPARRLTTVRGFLRYLAGSDGATEVPIRGLLDPTATANHHTSTPKGRSATCSKPPRAWPRPTD